MCNVAFSIGKQDSWNIYHSCGSVCWTKTICLLMFIFLTPVIEDWYTGSFMLMCYLMATCICQEIYEIQFRGNSNGMCVHTFRLKRNQLLQSDGLYTSMKSHNIYKSHACNMYRYFNSQVIDFIWYMDEELYTLYVSEYNRHEYTIYICMLPLW